MKNLIFGSGASSFKDMESLKRICAVAIESGILAFDTAPSYHTEEMIAEAVLTAAKNRLIDRGSLHIQTKIDPIQMYNGSIEEYFKSKLKLMHLDYVDALLIHWPVHKYFIKTWDELNIIKQHGLARKIGVCNLRIPHLKELKEIGVMPDILQIERHPLNSFSEEVRFCKDNSIIVQDYSPLCKMHPLLKNNKILNNLSEKYGRSVGLVILRWHVDTGATPIFTSKNEKRVEDYSQIDTFSLSKKDCILIESLNINHKLYLESLICPGF